MFIADGGYFFDALERKYLLERDQLFGIVEQLIIEQFEFRQ